MRHRFFHWPARTNRAVKQRPRHSFSCSEGLCSSIAYFIVCWTNLSSIVVLFLKMALMPWQHLGSPERGWDRRPTIFISSSSPALSLPSLCRHAPHCSPVPTSDVLVTSVAGNRFRVFSVCIFISLPTWKSHNPRVSFGKLYPSFKAKSESHLPGQSFLKHCAGSLFVPLNFSGIVFGTVPLPYYYWDNLGTSYLPCKPGNPWKVETRVHRPVLRTK